MMRQAVFLLGVVSCVGLASGASIRITNPDSTSAFHAGDAVPVQWYYTGEGENFSILLYKGDEQVADLCALEEGGLCFDLTQDQTVLLPETGLDSGSDYAVKLIDQSSELEHVSDTFTVIGSADTNIEITSPDGYTSLSAGEELSVSWLYVGDNNLFDIYLRQGDERMSENLCSSQSSGSCTSSNVGSATVTLPAEIEDGGDYRLLVVDTADDDAWGLSGALPIGVAAASRDGSSGSSSASKIGLVVGISVAAVCLLALVLCCMRKKNRDRRQEEKMATLDMLNKRRPAPSVALSVEGMARPDSPEAYDADDQRNFIDPVYPASQSFYDGQITPPPGDSAMWRRSRDLGRFVGRQISQSFSRSQSNMMND